MTQWLNLFRQLVTQYGTAKWGPNVPTHAFTQMNQCCRHLSREQREMVLATCP